MAKEIVQEFLRTDENSNEKVISHAETTFELDELREKVAILNAIDPETDKIGKA